MMYTFFSSASWKLGFYVVLRWYLSPMFIVVVVVVGFEKLFFNFIWLYIFDTNGELHCNGKTSTMWKDGKLNPSSKDLELPYKTISIVSLWHHSSSPTSLRSIIVHSNQPHVDIGKWKRIEPKNGNRNQKKLLWETTNGQSQLLIQFFWHLFYIVINKFATDWRMEFSVIDVSLPKNDGTHFAVWRFAMATRFPERKNYFLSELKMSGWCKVMM